MSPVPAGFTVVCVLLSLNASSRQQETPHRRYRTFETRGASFSVRVPLKGDAQDVKVIVYGYGADLIGTSVANVK